MTGTFWSVVWSPDSARVATAGGDKKVRIWDRESGAQVAEGSVGSALQDMQVGRVGERKLATLDVQVEKLFFFQLFG